MVRCQGNGTDDKVFACWCFISMQDITDILSSKPFHVFKADRTTELVSLMKFMIIASPSNAPTWIVQIRDDEKFMQIYQAQNLTQNNNLKKIILSILSQSVTCAL